MRPIAKTSSVFLALAICLLAAPASAQSALSGEQLQSTVSGQTFDGRNGMMRATISYGVDGSLEVRAMMRTLTGRWWIEGDTLCADMPEGPRAGQGCGQLVANRDGTYLSPNGMVLTPQ